MKKIISEIKNYILFLKKDMRLEISLHPLGSERLISESDLILFHIHENPYCIYVKTFPEAYKHCVNLQKKVFDKCCSGSFCGTCYAGVFEYVYPIHDSDLTVGFISVSGYKDKNYNSYIERCSEKFKLPREALHKTIQTLKDETPGKAYIDTLISPLIRMLELAYQKMTDANTDETSNTITEIINYVNRHYAENITLEQISRLFSRSNSCISHSFKKQTGLSFREYLINTRIRSAKSLLIYSDLNISEIAFSVGFNDSNYFSNAFKKYTGLSPGKYKKILRSGSEIT